MENLYSSFGIIDLIVFAVGFYGFYSWYLLTKKQEIKKLLLLGGSYTPEQCTDVRGFAEFMGTKLLILSAVMVVYGGVSVYDSMVEPIGAALWIGMAVFLAVIVWYCVELRKGNQCYFSLDAKSGKSIKEKAMKKS